MKLGEKVLCANCFEELWEGEATCPACGFDETAGNINVYPGALPVGTVLLGRYVIGKVLGKGGFGITYLAYDCIEEKKAAIKEYLPDTLSYRNPGSSQVSTYPGEQGEHFKKGVDKFFEEAQMVSRFNGNPGLIWVYKFFFENNTAYFAMEYLDGCDLKAYMMKRGGSLSEKQVLGIVLPLIDSLIVVHSIDVLHRDISPGNIYVTADGRVKLLDFGAARQVLSEVSKSLSVILKQGFTPIEQYQTKGKQGPWTDIYALGATMFYCLTGKVPDAPMDRLEDDTLEMPEGISKGMRNILKKMLAVRASGRYQDMVKLKADMKSQGLLNEGAFEPPEVEKPAVIERPPSMQVNTGAQDVEAVSVQQTGAEPVLATGTGVTPEPDSASLVNAETITATQPENTDKESVSQSGSGQILQTVSGQVSQSSIHPAQHTSGQVSQSNIHPAQHTSGQQTSMQQTSAQQTSMQQTAYITGKSNSKMLPILAAVIGVAIISAGIFLLSYFSGGNKPDPTIPSGTGSISTPPPKPSVSVPADTPVVTEPPFVILPPPDDPLLVYWGQDDMMGFENPPDSYKGSDWPGYNGDYYYDGAGRLVRAGEPHVYLRSDGPGLAVTMRENSWDSVDLLLGGLNGDYTLVVVFSTPVTTGRELTFSISSVEDEDYSKQEIFAEATGWNVMLSCSFPVRNGLYGTTSNRLRLNADPLENYHIESIELRRR